MKSSERGLQLDYSKKFAKYMYDENSRVLKAKRILLVFKEILNNDLTKLNCLEIGSSTGMITYFLSDYFSEIIGIDIDKPALDFARKNYIKNNIKYFYMDGTQTIFPDNYFDTIVCHHTYEHVAEPQKLINEIYRLLKKDGVCFFGAPNRLMIIESHYNLPFLSWLPRPASSFILRIYKNEKYYYEIMYSIYGLKKLLKDFYIIDYTLKAIKNPDKYFITSNIKLINFLKYFPNFILKLVYLFIPEYIFILKKK